MNYYKNYRPELFSRHLYESQKKWAKSEADVEKVIENHILAQTIQCECGSQTVNAATHSHWCPKYRGNNA